MDAPAYVLATLTKAEKAGAHPAELAALRRRLMQLDEPRAGLLPGEALEPLEDVAALDELPEPPAERAREVLDHLVVVKLNGGLGTSMGLTGPKSLLEVKPGMSFLDVIAAQVLAVRERHGARLPLLLMDSVATRGPSLAVLDRYDDLRDQGVPRDFLQGREPKLRADDLQPVEWPADPELEWCPPGHGDLYTALAASGTLDQLLDAGLRWCFVSNSDNLGATVDVRLAAWVAAERIPRHVDESPPRPARAEWPPWHRAPETCPPTTPPSPTSSVGASTTPTTCGLTCRCCGNYKRRTRRRRCSRSSSTARPSTPRIRRARR